MEGFLQPCESLFSGGCVKGPAGTSPLLSGKNGIQPHAFRFGPHLLLVSLLFISSRGQNLQPVPKRLDVRWKKINGHEENSQKNLPLSLIASFLQERDYPSIFPTLRSFLSFFAPHPLLPFPKLTFGHGKQMLNAFFLNPWGEEWCVHLVFTMCSALFYAFYAYLI